MTSATEKVPTFCALCVSHCGAIASVENGVFTALEPDPSHPTGQALCIKGKVAPELVYHRERLLHPLKRTRPKGDADPGWVPISWDEALSLTAEKLLEIKRRDGAEAVVFTAASPSTSALSDCVHWIDRLRRAFGSPNLCTAMELCGWGRYLASWYTFGAPVPGVYLPDLENAGCILFWGYNPSVARLAHAVATSEALKRGARLIVVDPRRAGLAHKADVWLRVRPGTDAALALSLSHVMLERGLFDRTFVARWTNAAFLVRPDNGRLLRESDLRENGDASRFVAWDEAGNAPFVLATREAISEEAVARLSLFGEHTLETRDGPLTCRPVLAHVAEKCAAYAPRKAEAITNIAAADIERAATMLWESRPVAYYSWSGIEQQDNSTQTTRAITQLYALTGSFDARGGNVAFASAKKNPVDGAELLSREQAAKTIGLAERPLGPPRWEFVTSGDLYTAVLEGRPYPVRGLVGFGSNLLLSTADSARGRDALAKLDFFVHADIFMNPTAELADIVLPVATPFETEGLAVGFEISAEAQSLVQLRRPAIPARGEARSDTQIIFALGCHLGLGEHFWNGDVDAGLKHLLAPSSVTLEALRATPAGVRLSLETRHRKFAEATESGVRGFGTPSGSIELYSEALLSQGQPPLAEFVEPKMTPRARRGDRYPLLLTCAKSMWFCESQHRQLASLRRRAPDPRIEIHPAAARARGIADGDWVRIETPTGSVRARASLSEDLEPNVVCGEHGWWQGCAEIGAPAQDPFSANGTNFNLVIPYEPHDPVSGTAPHRAYACDVVRE